MIHLFYSGSFANGIEFSTRGEEDEEARKKRADALFDAFLADTDEPTTSVKVPPIHEDTG